MNENINQENENICCPELAILPCADTDIHNHFYCDSKYVLEDFLISNILVRNICMGNFRQCKYFPKGEE